MEGPDSMTDEKRKHEPPMFLDMDFDEALRRFTKAKPEEVRESIDRAKQKSAPGDKAARRRPKDDGQKG